MGINLSGVGLIRPNFWTAYDPSSRFLQSIYLDPGIMKFVPRRRAGDFIPETTFKVCEAPNITFFDRDVGRGFADFLDPGHSKIVDWADSFVQAIEILYRLGFRKLLLAGCDMRVQPSREQIRLASTYGVKFSPFGRLRDFVHHCERAGLTTDALDRCVAGPHYHFDERKTIRAAMRTDEHYLRIVQALRLSRRSMATAGLKIVSVTPHSRLNDYFAYQPLRKLLREIEADIGTVAPASLRGRYQHVETPVLTRYGPIEDILPYRRIPPTGKTSPTGEPGRFDDECEIVVERHIGPEKPASHSIPRLVRALERMHDVPETICEEG